MKPISKYSKQIVVFLFVMIVTCNVLAEDKLNCQKIIEEQYPALVFVEGPVDESHLYVAYLDGETLHRENILSSKYIQVIQLDNDILLVTAQSDPKKGAVYAIDLSTGTVKSLAESIRIHCLRAEPFRKTAMLMESNASNGEVQLIELNLDTFETTLRCSLSKKTLGDKFDGIVWMKISPNFTHIAYVSKKTPPMVERKSEYILRVLDLLTMEVRELDNNVSVQISAVSSFSHGRPPFEWIDNNEILYQDMEPNNTDDISPALHIFRTVNIKTGKITECFRKVLPLTLDGGSIITNPLNGELIYNNNWILNLEKKTLTDRDLPFKVVLEHSERQTKIIYGTDILYDGNKSCPDTCISASGKNFAYSLRAPGGNLDVELWAKFEGKSEPIKIAEGPLLPTRPIAWIEKTNLPAPNRD